MIWVIVTQEFKTEHEYTSDGCIQSMGFRTTKDGVIVVGENTYNHFRELFPQDVEFIYNPQFEKVKFAI